MKAFVLFIFLSTCIISLAQSPTKPTSSFTIFGQVEKSLIVTFADLQKEPQVHIDSLQIFNYKGTHKGTYRNIKGVRLLDIVKKLTIQSPDAKTLSEFYLIAKAADGYTVVISWNELFNSHISDFFILFIEADNMSQQDSPERILLMATKDLMTGRRHVKGLASIEIKRS